MTFIRDPLWNNIRIDGPFLRLADTPVVQRLRYVRQLGLAHLVYPGATHSRFEHALGAFHLANRTLRRFEDAGMLNSMSPDEGAVVAAAALLHDVGHYPFSHALEEIGAMHHEAVAEPMITGGEVAAILRSEIAADAPERVFALMRGESDSPLQGLISGSLDLDKTDYLKRDALMCGVPYGEIDVDRLLHALVVVEDPHLGHAAVGVREKALSALESLLFAKYQMFRNVYWHHAVRSPTAMYKRLVDDALRAGALQSSELVAHTDEGLLHALRTRTPSALLDAILSRRLYKRAMECPAAELDGVDLEWIAEDRERSRRAEDAIAASLGLAPGEVLLDYPQKEQMLGLDIPVLTRDGRVERLTSDGMAGAINLPVLADQLYRSARWLRVFTVRRESIKKDDVLRLLGV
ncbi:MAG: HD domain-containing protein [Gemmatimonadaceae bacterium]|nr:HD domain-containing protein [Gemmatimonadaceae bacterium]